jgi:Meckel syndrome type 1 protein
VFAQPQAAPVEVEAERADKSAATPAPPARDAPLQSLDATIFPSKEAQKTEAAASVQDGDQKDGSRGRAKATSGAVNPAQSRAAPTAMAPEFVPAPAAAMTAAPNNRLYPEHWISNIEKLLRENRRDEAIRNLDEFRKQYPDYRLPDDLRELK